MNSDQMTTHQAAQVRQRLVPALAYLSRLGKRMEQVGFPANDALYRLAVAAYDAVHDSTIELHYRSCRGGVGRPSQPSKEYGPS